MSSPAGDINSHVQEATMFSTARTMEEPTVTYSDTHVQTRKATEALGNIIDPIVCPPVIPPDHTNRTLVLCFDGTGDQFDADNSNVVQLVQLLKKNDRTKQLVYYQSGIGTYTVPQVASPFMSRIKKTLDVMFGWYLDAHIMSGYEFLMQNYIAGDKICIFGFSRGAYTARSLVGMLYKVGLLPAGNHQQIPFAYKIYTRVDEIGWEQSTEFKKAFSEDVPIEFMGVWDTVGSVSTPVPFTTSNTIIRTFRHALSLDERRAKFQTNVWFKPSSEEAKLGSNSTTTSEPSSSSPVKVGGVASPAPRPSAESFNDPASLNNCSEKGLAMEDVSPSGNEKNNKEGTKRNNNGHRSLKEPKEGEGDRVLNTLETVCSVERKWTTDIEEVWFAGCHCDVGGGSVLNKTPHSLARIALRWMVRECFKANTGMMFKSSALKEIGMDPSTLYPLVKPRPPLPSLSPTDRIRTKEIPIRAHMHTLATEEEEDLQDVLSPKYDQLKIKKGWWVLELIPLHLRYQNGDLWVSRYGVNMAGPRFIPGQRTNGLRVHRSVKLRMEADFEDEKRRNKGKKYVPKPLFNVEPTWID